MNLLLQDLAARDIVPRLYYKEKIASLTRSPLLLGSVTIRSLDVHGYTAAEMDALKPIVFTLPRLDCLSIRTASLSDEYPVKYVFSLQPGDIVPPVRTLCLRNICFDPKQADVWAECLQHNTLRHLELDGCMETMDLLTCLTGCLLGLTSLAIRAKYNTQLETQQLSNKQGPFLSEVRCLSAFSGYNLSQQILPTVVSRHGTNLQQLRFCEMPYLSRFRVRDDWDSSSEDIRNLAPQLPNLPRLEINLEVGDRLVSSSSCTSEEETR